MPFGVFKVFKDPCLDRTLESFFRLTLAIPESDLLVSFDAFSFQMPPEITKRGWNQNHTWYHTDQSYTRNNLESIQSWITGLDVEEGDATLAFLEGSNRFHKSFADHWKKTASQDVKILWNQLTSIKKQLEGQNSSGGATVRSSITTGAATNWPAWWVKGHYCWTHDYGVKHTSATCPRKGKGHKARA